MMVRPITARRQQKTKSPLALGALGGYPSRCEVEGDNTLAQAPHPKNHVVKGCWCAWCAKRRAESRKNSHASFLRLSPEEYAERMASYLETVEKSAVETGWINFWWRWPSGCRITIPHEIPRYQRKFEQEDGSRGVHAEAGHCTDPDCFCQPHNHEAATLWWKTHKQRSRRM